MRQALGTGLRDCDVSRALGSEKLAPVAVLAPSPRWAEKLSVASVHQGPGPGARLLHMAQDGADGQLQLWTFRRNTRARAVRERHGFAEVCRTGVDTEQREPGVRYRWVPAGPAEVGGLHLSRAP